MKSEQPTNVDTTFDDFLAKHLQVQHDYIDDDGFSARVMVNLPAPRKMSTLLEKLIIGVPVLLIAVLVFSQFPWRTMIQPAYATLLTINAVDMVKVGFVLFTIMSVSMVVWSAKRLDIF